VLDRALAAVEVRGSAKAAWRERLHAVLGSYAQVLAAAPGLAQLALGTVAVGPNALRITETLLAQLESGGVDSATGAWAVDLLVLYVTAIVAEHAGGLDPAAPEGIVARAIGSVSAQDYPRVHAAREHLLAGTPQERFSWALDVFLRGIVQTPRSPQTTPAPASSRALSATKKARR
jgi:hypothetical protein